MVGTGHRAWSMAMPVFLLCAIVFWSHLLVASGTIFGSDAARRFLVTQNLIEHGRVDIQVPDLAPLGPDGKQYSQSALGHSLLMIPFYELGKQVAILMPQRRNEIIEFCVSLTNLFVTVVLIGWLAVFARELGFSQLTSVGLALVYAFATMAWQQAKDSHEHPLVVLCFMILFYYLHRFSQRQQIASLWLAGLALGMAIMTRYTAVLAFVAVVVFLCYLAWQSTSPGRMQKALYWLAIIALTTFPFLGFDLWFNYIRFGSPFETGYQQLLGNIFSPDTFLYGLWELTLHWDRGLFFYNPVYLFVLVGLPSFYRQHKMHTTAFLILICSYLVFHASLSEELRHGGWAWGPRYLMDVTPFLLLMCGPVFENFRQWSHKLKFLKSGVALLVAVLVAVSVLVQVESILVNYNRGFTKRALGINGHSLDSYGFKESMLHIQAENVLEISQNLWKGRGPSKERIDYSKDFKTGSSLDDSLTFGTFQIWWVYALHLGVNREWIVLYLFVNLMLLGVSIWRLRRCLHRERRIALAVIRSS